jgi:hypothetical protein
MTNPNPEDPDRKCKTCFYCEKYEVPNLQRHLLSFSEFKELLPETDIFYKCHIQGPPANVNPKYDWCYQWRLKE